MHDDGLAYVKEEGEKESHPPKHQMSDSVPFSEALAEAVIESAEECPGECIFIESDD